MPTKGPIITPTRAGLIRPALDSVKLGEGSVSSGGAPPVEPPDQTYYFVPVILALVIND